MNAVSRLDTNIRLRYHITYRRTCALFGGSRKVNSLHKVYRVYQIGTYKNLYKTGGSRTKTTKDSLNEILSENHDAKLLIVDVVTHISANLYCYHSVEITVQKALDVWHKAQAADGEEDGFYSTSFLDFSKESAPLPSGLQHALT